jgi:hypothetical protein
MCREAFGIPGGNVTWGMACRSARAVAPAQTGESRLEPARCRGTVKPLLPGYRAGSASRAFRKMSMSAERIALNAYAAVGIPAIRSSNEVPIAARLRRESDQGRLRWPYPGSGGRRL